MLLKTEQIAGVDIDLHVTNDGRFYGEADDIRIGSAQDTLDKAKQSIRAELAKRKVRVVVHFRTRTGQRGIAHGVNAGNGKVLAKLQDRRGEFTRNEQLDVGFGGRFFRADTPDEVIDRLKWLQDERTKLGNELRDLENEWSIALQRQVHDAINAKAQEIASREAA